MKGAQVHFSSKSVDWRTPKEVYDGLNLEFNFNFDPCPYQSEDKTFLLKNWGKKVFCNPPYNNIYNFMEKALVEIKKENTEIAVFLVPSRTDSKWFHELVLPNYEEIRLIRGRLKFKQDNQGKINNAPFPSCIIIFKKKKQNV